MQRKSGTKKSDRSSVGRFGKNKNSSFAIILPLLCCLLFQACSTSKKNTDQKLPINGIDSALKAVCLAGEGRGQIGFLSENYSFDFETVLNREKEEWNLGVSLPFYGEEVMKLEFKNAYQRNNKITGKFAERIFNNTQKISVQYREILDLFLQDIALFIKFVSSIDNKQHSCMEENQQGYCKLISSDRFHFLYNTTRLELSFQEKEYLSFHLTFTDVESSKFGRMRAYFENSRESEGKRNPIQLDLLIDKCLE